METTPKEELTEEEKAEKLTLISDIEAKIQDIERMRQLLIEARDKKDAERMEAYSHDLRTHLSEGKALKRKLEGKTDEAEITATYTRTHEDGKKEKITIELNFENILDDHLAFYGRHKVTLPPNFEDKVRAIWYRNRDAIEQSIVEHGFDTVLVVSGGTDLSNLNALLTKGYKAETKEWVPISGIIEAVEVPRLVLLHKTKELDDIPELKATLGKQADDPLIKDEDLNLSDYLIFQRKFFDETKTHIDEKRWTWLPGSKSGARVVNAGWLPAHGQLRVSANDPDYSNEHLGCRLSRSFL